MITIMEAVMEMVVTIGTLVVTSVITTVTVMEAQEFQMEQKIPNHRPTNRQTAGVSPDLAAKSTTNTYNLKTLNVGVAPVDPSEEKNNENIETEKTATKNAESIGVFETYAPKTEIKGEGTDTSSVYTYTEDPA